MLQDIWINLAVKNVAKSAEFFTEIGFSPNPGPGNTDQSASFTIGTKAVVLMLFAEEAFARFVANSPSSQPTGSEALFSLGVDSREQVDAIADRVRAAGGILFAEPEEANGFIYGCGFCDPDGYRWNVMYMDRGKTPES